MESADRAREEQGASRSLALCGGARAHSPPSQYTELAAADKARADAERADKKALKAREQPKKPPTAYMRFVKAKRADVVARNPDMAFADVGRELGRLWRAMSDYEKDQFKSD